MMNPMAVQLKGVSPLCIWDLWFLPQPCKIMNIQALLKINFEFWNNLKCVGLTEKLQRVLTSFDPVSPRLTYHIVKIHVEKLKSHCHVCIFWDGLFGFYWFFFPVMFPLGLESRVVSTLYLLNFLKPISKGHFTWFLVYLLTTHCTLGTVRAKVIS